MEVTTASAGDSCFFQISLLVGSIILFLCFFSKGILSFPRAFSFSFWLVCAALSEHFFSFSNAACVTKIGFEKSVSALEFELVSLLRLITSFKFLINMQISLLYHLKSLQSETGNTSHLAPSDGNSIELFKPSFFLSQF